jgi:hypothetical protein
MFGQQKPMRSIEVRLESTNVVMRRRCWFCKGATYRALFHAEVYQLGKRTGFVVCESCEGSVNEDDWVF